MRRVAPDPPVVIMAGDFLAHEFKAPTAIPTMVWLARRFDRAFPRAQFVITLGNEDSACGDYANPPDSTFIRAAAAAWAPLVDRRGAAPDFARTFGHDGFYTAALPIPGLRAVVVDDAFWSVFHHDGCGTSGDPTPGSLAELERAVRPGRTERRWLIMHIPPGVDASSTVRLTHRLAIVPFLRPQPRDAATALISDPARRIVLVVTGHVHRFAFRIVDDRGRGPVPVLVAPAISPLLGNAPSFVTADIGPDGTLRNLEEHSYVGRSWHDIGGTASLGMSEFSGSALMNVQRRLAEDSALRATYARLYVGGAPFHEITEGNWRSYWCASTAFNASAYRRCVDVSGFGLLTGRGVAVVAIVAVALLVPLAAAAIWLLRRRRLRRTLPGA
jgi:hypothetical protein